MVYCGIVMVPTAVTEYLAPSWSWASRDFTGPDSARPYFWMMKMIKKEVFPMAETILKKSDAMLATEDPYGRVKEGSSITLCGRVVLPERWVRDGGRDKRALTLYPRDSVWPKGDESPRLTIPLAHADEEVEEHAAES